MNLSQFQEEVLEWGKKNFPDTKPEMLVLGIAEETGELAHATLKQLQGIRGAEEVHVEEAQDAVGDLIVFVAHFCGLMGWDLETIISETWANVKERDWVKNNENGEQ